MADLSRVREGYDRWASVYDHDANPLLAFEEPVVHELVGEPRGLRALDLGCGAGRHALWLAGQGAEVTAVDFSEGMLAEARRKPGGERVEFLIHDLHQPLPFEDAAFDLAVSGLVLEHIQDLAPLFREVSRVLKPAGRAVISAMHPAMFERQSQARFTDPDSGQIVAPGSVNHSLDAMRTAATAAGFAVEAEREAAPDEEFARRFPRAAKYVGWPMLAALALRCE